LPLVDLIAGTGSDERQLSDKATGLLRNRLGKSKDFPLDVDSEEATTVLDELHRRARRAHSSEGLATLSHCSLFLSRVILHPEADDFVLRVYRGSLVDFITRKASTLNATFFHDFIRRYPTSGWSLRDDIIDTSRKAANVYRQCQAFQLLHVIVNQMPALVRAIRHKVGFRD
jgi:DNA polymerase phi